MDNLDIPMMIRTLLESVVTALNFLIPVKLPDGTQIGAWIVFGFISLLLAVVIGKKIKSKIE